MTELRITSTPYSPTNVIGWRLPLDAITRRETEVLQAITDGCSTPQIAARLYLSQKTVKNHLASIYQKLDARDRTQAILIALRLGIVQLERSDAA
jgi:two-component system response regulator DegU